MGVPASGREDPRSLGVTWALGLVGSTGRAACRPLCFRGGVAGGGPAALNEDKAWGEGLGAPVGAGLGARDGASEVGEAGGGALAGPEVTGTSRGAEGGAEESGGRQRKSVKGVLGIPPGCSEGEKDDAWAPFTADH